MLLVPSFTRQMLATQLKGWQIQWKNSIPSGAITGQEGCYWLCQTVTSYTLFFLFELCLACERRLISDPYFSPVTTGNTSVRRPIGLWKYPTVSHFIPNDCHSCNLLFRLHRVLYSPDAVVYHRVGVLSQVALVLCLHLHTGHVYLQRKKMKNTRK